MIMQYIGPMSLFSEMQYSSYVVFSPSHWCRYKLIWNHLYYDTEGLLEIYTLALTPVLIKMVKLRFFYITHKTKD